MGPSLLVVDDSRLARMVVAGIVKRLRPDWTLLEASNAEEALALLRQREVHVVLLDVNMPGMNGLDLARSLRETRPDMPIAIISANIQDDVAAAARAMEAVFLAKPVTEDSISPFLGAAALRLRRSGG